MNDYKKAIIAVIVIILVLIGGFWFFGKEKPTELEQGVIDFLENNVLTEDQKSDLAEAIDLLKQNPDNTDALIIIARVKQQAGDYKGAEKIYLEAIEKQPTNTLLLNNLGSVYSSQEKWEDAERIYLRIIKQTPKWISAYRDLGDIYKYHLKDKYSDMEQILLTAIEVTADITEYAPVDLYIMLGSYYKKTDNTSGAIKYYEIALKLMPENSGVQRELELLKN